MSSFIFLIDGEEHSQEGFYDSKTKEAILTSPAHSGYSATISVLSTKNETHPGRVHQNTGLATKIRTYIKNYLYIQTSVAIVADKNVMQFPFENYSGLLLVVVDCTNSFQKGSCIT